MGKRSVFFASVLLIGGLAELGLPVASAQISTTGAGDSDCGSGLYSSVDGNCMGADQSLGIDQQGSQLGSQQDNSLNSAGSFGQSLPAGQLSQQYPGLQSPGMNARVPNFYDQSGFPPSQAQRQALSEEKALAALRSYSPPTEFQRLVRASWGALLPVYGDSLFQVVPSTFAPVRQIPVTADYVLGPGDQLVIRIWGQVNYNSELTVDRSGAVYLPQVGAIHVAGLPYSQLEQHLHDAVARIYKNFNLEVELGQLRAIQVFVVGQARRPGTYTLSSLSTLVTAIFATGGPSVQGSLRDIQVKRNGQTVTHFDLYDLLIKGDKSKDVPLLAGDVVYIPPVGPQVAVAGSVRYPAIYELKGATPVSQVLEFAGGLSSTASVLRASLERIDAHKDRTAVDIALEGAGLETPLREGDILRILPISPEFQNTVTLRGNVAEQGRFSWHPGMRLSEIIPDSQSLITRDYWERRNQLGIPGPEFKPEYGTNPDLYPRGSQNNGAPASSNSAPGVAVNANGQLTPNLNNSEDALNVNGIQAQQNAQNGEGGQNAQSNTPPSNSAGRGGLSNEVQAPLRGTPPPRPPLDVELPVPEIDWSYAVIERLNPQTLTTSLVPFNPGKLVLEHDASQDLVLAPGDVVTVFSQADIRVPQAQRTKYVRLEGEFKQAGIYSVLPGETLRQLVARAGGFTPAAYLFGSDFTRESTRVIQQQRLDEYIQQLELEIDRATVANAAGAISPMDTASAASETAASQSLVAKFRTLRASGRIVLNVDPNAVGLDSLPEIALEDGDRFAVPAKPDTVNVVGAVYEENAFLFEQTRRVGGYLKLAGGATRDADGKHAFIIRADGSVVSRQAESGVFGNTFDATRLFAGDTVVVPEKVPKPTALRNINNLTGIFSQLALGSGGHRRREVEEAARMHPVDEIAQEPIVREISPEPAPSTEFDLIDLLLVLAARKRFVFFGTLAALLITAIICFAVRPNFTAQALIMPPQQQQSSASALLGQFGSLASVAGMGSSLGLKNPSDLYIGILQSESVANDLIQRFGLMRVYRAKKMSQARKRLAADSKFLSGKDGLISIAVVDHDPNRAAALANAYIDQLYSLNNRLAISEASQRRLFFEQQLAQEKDRLADAEVALKATEESTGLIAPTGQTEVAIRQIAQLQAEITSREIQLQALSTSSTGENPDVIRLNTELEGLRGQLQDLENGSEKHLPGNVSITTANVPRVGLEYVRKERDVKYHQLLFDMIARQYELARLDEAKAAPVIQVVDHAQAPDRKSGPARGLWTLVGGALGFLVCCIWAFVAHLHSRMKADAVQGRRLAALTRELKLRG